MNALYALMIFIRIFGEAESPGKRILHLWSYAHSLLITPAPPDDKLH